MTDNTQLDSKKYGRPEEERIIPFMKIAMPAALFSILITVASIFFIATKGLNLGLDFTGLFHFKAFDVKKLSFWDK